MKKSFTTDELGRFFVTGPADAVGKPSHFFCRICRKNVSLLTHGPFGILGHFQGARHFHRDQRFRLETPGWGILDFDGNALADEEVQRPREKILLAPLVKRDRERVSIGVLLVNGSGAADPNLPVLPRVFSLMEDLRLGGTYVLVETLWSRLFLAASQTYAKRNVG